MSEHRKRNHAVLVVVLVCMLPIPFLIEFHDGPTTPSIQYLNTGFAAKVLLMVSPPNYDSPGSDPNVSMERLSYIGADGIMMGFERWWDNVELYRDTLRQYRDSGYLVAGMWGHHCEYLRYCTRFNPPIHDWAMAHQHKQMAVYWRVYINSSVTLASAYEHGELIGSLSPIQNQDGTMTIKIRDLDYYEPMFRNGARYNVSSVYEEYPASEFSWLYDESGVNYDVRKTRQEKGTRMPYGTGYVLYIEGNSLYVTIYDPHDRDLNLYVLFYIPSFPSVYTLEGRNAWLDTLRDFLAPFSEYLDAFLQNSGGFPVPEGDFNPEIIKSVEAKYGIDFNFDNWFLDLGPIYNWDRKHLTQYAFDRENYFIFKDYAKEKQGILHEYDIIYVPTGSDTRHMVWAMVEHIDSLLVNSFLDSYRVTRYGWSWATRDWTPSTVRLGIWNSYIMREDSSGDHIREWGVNTIDNALKWNPDGATMTFWTGYDLTDEQWEALKEVTQYMHERFKHLLMIPSGVERYTVAKAYQISHQNRYGPTIDLNPGQVDIYPIYVKDLKWDPLPTDGCLLYDGGGGGVVDYASPIDDTEAHEKIIQAVKDGASIAFSGLALRRTGVYYEDSDIPTILNDAFQTEGWTHKEIPGYVSHYLTFNGTLDPTLLNTSDGDGYQIKLKSDASANVITGEFPYVGLYEAALQQGRVIGYSRELNPLKTTPFLDARSATYGDEYSVRFLEYCAGNEGDFRLWDVGKTFVYKADESTYYALLVERFGISRDVPVIVYGQNPARIIDMDTNEEIQNDSTIHLGANSSKLLMIRLGGF